MVQCEIILVCPQAQVKECQGLRTLVFKWYCFLYPKTPQHHFLLVLNNSVVNSLRIDIAKSRTSQDKFLKLKCDTMCNSIAPLSPHQPLFTSGQLSSNSRGVLPSRCQGYNGPTKPSQEPPNSLCLLLSIKILNNKVRHAS